MESWRGRLKLYNAFDQIKNAFDQPGSLAILETPRLPGVIFYKGIPFINALQRHAQLNYIGTQKPSVANL